MRNNFRTKKYTSRLTNISKAQIDKLRSTRLKNARNYKETKFFNSKQFDKQVRANIRSNRAKTNISRLDRIVKAIGGTKDREKVVRALFGETTTLNSKGNKVRKNTFTSIGQTNRLKKIEESIKNGSFDFPTYLKKSKHYKAIKKFLPEDPTTDQIIDYLTKSEFYLENRGLIMKHNKNVSEHGKWLAETKKEGIKLRNKYIEKLSKENQDFINFSLNKK